jgi:hypothetical protein
MCAVDVYRRCWHVVRIDVSCRSMTAAVFANVMRYCISLLKIKFCSGSCL